MKITIQLELPDYWNSTDENVDEDVVDLSRILVGVPLTIRQLLYIGGSEGGLEDPYGRVVGRVKIERGEGK